MKTGVFPGDRNNYRSMADQPTISKILEAVTKIRLTKHLIDENLLTQCLYKAEIDNSFTQ